VETILLNQFYRAEIGAMRPNQEMFDGKFTSSAVGVRTRGEYAALGRELGIESIAASPNAANDETSHRMLIKKNAARVREDNPQVIKNIFNSVKNVKAEYL